MRDSFTVTSNGVSADRCEWAAPEREHRAATRRAGPLDAESLRRLAWEIGERRATDRYAPPVNHVGLAMVNPTQGFVHWHLSPGWVEQARQRRRDAWHHCRMVVRLYDVSYIQFNGLNAHRIQDHPLPGLCGHLFFPLSAGAGTWRLAEVGFLLRDGEFLPGARSQVAAFARDSASPHSDHTALLVDHERNMEEVGNVWDQERFLAERAAPRLRSPLRIASFAFESLASGQETGLARFVTELAAAQCALGHEVHVFLPAAGEFTADLMRGGVYYHPLHVGPTATCLDAAREFARSAAQSLDGFPPFDLINLHEWMTGYAGWYGARPTVVAFGSIEAARRGGAPPTEESQQIEQVERELAQAARCLLVPHGLWSRAVEELGPDRARVHGFSMEGRPPDEWEVPLDFGQAKMEVGIGPLDRMLLYVGPLEHAAGVDLLVEALPVILQRMHNARLAFAGAGSLAGALDGRARELGVAHAVRSLGHVEFPQLSRLLRASEAVVLPSRCRIPLDDAVVELARRAGRPVITTRGGPAHLVRHEETGIITYDNPGSMVWAMDRILGDSAHADQMGRNGRRHETAAPSWEDAARRYFELCVRCIAEVTVRRGSTAAG
jgi:glycosyltransferase involved in cell wall biosynthesis